MMRWCLSPDGGPICRGRRNLFPELNGSLFRTLTGRIRGNGRKLTNSPGNVKLETVSKNCFLYITLWRNKNKSKLIETKRTKNRKRRTPMTDKTGGRTRGIHRWLEKKEKDRRNTTLTVKSHSLIQFVFPWRCLMASRASQTHPPTRPPGKVPATLIFFSPSQYLLVPGVGPAVRWANIVFTLFQPQL